MASVAPRLQVTAPPPSERKGLFKLISSSSMARPRRIVLYGVQGVGKSTWASQAPAPIFLPTEEGLNNLDAQAYPLLFSWENVQEAVEALYTEEHSFRTVVIDSIDRLEHLIWADVCAEHRMKNIEDAGYGKGYVYALSRWNWLFQGLDALRAQRAMTVILIAHAKIERFEAPETASYDRYGVRLNKHAAACVQEWADEVLFATYEVFVKAEKGGFGKEKGKAIGQGNRILRTSERPFASAKNRLGLPDEIPFVWSEFEKYLPAIADRKEDVSNG